jgi:large subunit ribosomal protein L9
MKVLLLQDVYKLGRAGDVKKVANGYGRNYLIPQNLAVLATAGAMAQSDTIRDEADKKRAVLNEEMSGVVTQLAEVNLTFPARASETGRLYGSINTRMIAEAISESLEVEISHRQIDSQPLRMIGEHTVNVRLTVDLIPEIKVIVHREGESIAAALEEAAANVESEEFEDVVADVEAEVAEETAEEAVEEVAAEVTEENAETEA